MSEQQVRVIDVSEMSQKELCDILGQKYVPWYKSTMFWVCFASLGMPSLVQLLDVLVKIGVVR